MNLCNKKVLRCKIFLTIAISFLQVAVYSQIKKNLVADSLKRDTIKKTKIFVSKSDSIDNFAPIDNLDYSKITTNFSSKNKNPGRAALYSLIIPGLGQAYNEKYWKIPIIYGLFIGMYYLYDNNNFRYNLFDKAWKTYDTENRVVTTPGINPGISEEQLKKSRDGYRRDKNYNIIIGIVLYLFNILDANVDAHLMDFDVSDDLSMRVTPEINNMSIFNQKNNSHAIKNSFGLKFAISINKRKK